MNICIGGDLDGQVVDLKKAYFKGKEVQDNSASEYRKQTYIFEDGLYYFWIANDLSLSEATKRIELILQKPKNWLKELIEKMGFFNCWWSELNVSI